MKRLLFCAPFLLMSCSDADSRTEGGADPDAGIQGDGGRQSDGGGQEGGDGIPDGTVGDDASSSGHEDTDVACHDGKDNDNDGHKDCDDFECAAFCECSEGAENSEAACSDGCSNDGDKWTDCDDHDCACAKVCGGEGCDSQSEENTAALCSDGISNDGDQWVDCDDYDCCAVVDCPAESACGSTQVVDYVSTSPADCQGTGTVSYVFSSTSIDFVTVALATTEGYTILGYTRDTISSGPFPLIGTDGEKQVRVGPYGGELLLGLFRWDTSEWSTIEGGNATYSNDTVVVLADGADSLFATYSCVGYVEGTAQAPVSGGVDTMLFEFKAPIVGMGFPGL